MVDEYLPVGLAALAGVGAVAFVVGAALWAAQAFGVWAGVTVGGIAVTIVGSVGLYAVGTVEEANRRDRQERF